MAAGHAVRLLEPGHRRTLGRRPEAVPERLQGRGLSGLWFHDLRRSFVTNARRYGMPESVVMRKFERYNVVAEEDLRAAVTRIEGARAQLQQETVKVPSPPSETQKPPRLTTGTAQRHSVAGAGFEPATFGL